jgi:hypothetical protein
MHEQVENKWLPGIRLASDCQLLICVIEDFKNLTGTGMNGGHLI